MTVHLSPEYLEHLTTAMAGHGMSETCIGLIKLTCVMKILDISRVSVKEGDWLNKIKFELEAKGIKLPKEFYDEEIRLVREAGC